jgi:hypothetical protein
VIETLSVEERGLGELHAVRRRLTLRVVHLTNFGDGGLLLGNLVLRHLVTEMQRG